MEAAGYASLLNEAIQRPSRLDDHSPSARLPAAPVFEFPIASSIRPTSDRRGGPTAKVVAQLRRVRIERVSADRVLDPHRGNA